MLYVKPDRRRLGAVERTIDAGAFGALRWRGRRRGHHSVHGASSAVGGCRPTPLVGFLQRDAVCTVCGAQGAAHCQNEGWFVAALPPAPAERGLCVSQQLMCQRNALPLRTVLPRRFVRQRRKDMAAAGEHDGGSCTTQHAGPGAGPFAARSSAQCTGSCGCAPLTTMGFAHGCVCNRCRRADP